LTCYERIRQKIKELPNQDEWERKATESILKELALMEHTASLLPEPKSSQLIMKIEDIRRDFFKNERKVKRIG